MRTLINILIPALIILWSCGDKGNTATNLKSKDNSIADSAMAIYSENPKRALWLLDSAERTGALPSIKCDLMRARIYSYPGECSNTDTAQAICKKLLLNDTVKGDLKYMFDVIEQMKVTTAQQEDYEQEILYASQLVEICKKLGDEPEELRTEAEIGSVQAKIGNRAEGLQKLNMVIGKLEGKRKFAYADACIIALKRKTEVLSKEGRHDEIINTAKKIIAITDDYEEHPDDYDDKTFRIPYDKDRAKYCDFYRSQAYSLIANAYAKKGDMKNARKYAQKFENTTYGQGLIGRINFAPTWCLLGDYGKMQSAYDEYNAISGKDTLSTDYATQLECRAIAAAATGRYVESQDYWKRYSKLSNKLNDKLQVSKAHEYAARFREQEQELEIQKQEAALIRQNIYFATISIIALLAAGFATYFFRQRKAMTIKNQALVSQISDANKYKQKYAQLKESIAATEVSTPIQTDELNDEKLFELLSQTTIQEKLYLDPNFGRQTLMERFGISKERVGSAFSNGSNYHSLPAFINECRLTHAVKLMNEQPGMSIEQVALSSGYSSSNTFGRNFRLKFAMSPTEYRNSNTQS